MQKGSCFLTFLTVALLGLFVTSVVGINFSAGITGPVDFEQVTLVNMLQLSAFEAANPNNVNGCRALTANYLLLLNEIAYEGISPACAAAILPANCVGFTKAGVNALNPTAFAALNAACYANIPSASCQGITALQLTALPTSAFLSLSNLCLQQLESTSCSGITVAQLTGLSASQSSSISAECYANLSSTICPTLSSAQLTDLLAIPALSQNVVTAACVELFPNALCSALTSAILDDIPAQAFAGFTAGCTALWPGPCSTISAAAIGNLSPIAFGSIGAVCLGSISDCSQVSPSQLALIPPALIANLAACFAQLPPISCHSLTPAQLANLSAAALNSLSAECFANFNDLTCNALTAAIFAEIPSLTIQNGMTASCLEALNPTLGCIGLTYSNLLAMDPAVATSIHPECLANIPGASCANVPPASLENLSPALLHLLAQDCLSSLTTAQCTALSPFNELLPNQISDLSAACCQSLSAADISSLSQAQIASLSETCVAEFADSVCEGFGSAEALSALPPSVLNALPVECIKNIPSDSCNGFTSAQIEALSPTTFQNLSASCLANLEASACSVISADQITAMISVLGSSTGLSFSPSCIAAINPNTCTAFTAPVLASTAPNTLLAATAACIGSVPGETCAALENINDLTYLLAVVPTFVSSTCVANFNVESICSKFTTAILTMIPPQSYAGFTADCFGAALNNNNNVNCAGLNALAIQSLSPEAFSVISKCCFKKIQLELCDSLCAEQLEKIPADIFCAVSPKLCLKKLQPKACEGFTAEQISALSCKQIRSLSKECIHNLERHACKGLTPELVKCLKPEMFEDGGMTVKCFKAIPSLSCAGFTAGQISHFQRDFFPKLSDKCLFNLRPCACKGFGYVEPGVSSLSLIRHWAFRGIRPKCIKNIDPSLFSCFHTPHKIFHMCRGGNQGITGFTAEHFRYLPDGCFRGFNRDCIKDIDPLCFHGVTRRSQIDTWFKENDNDWCPPKGPYHDPEWWDNNYPDDCNEPWCEGSLYCGSKYRFDQDQDCYCGLRPPLYNCISKPQLDCIPRNIHETFPQNWLNSMQ